MPRNGTSAVVAIAFALGFVGSTSDTVHAQTPAAAGPAQADPLVLARVELVEPLAQRELPITTATALVQFPGAVVVDNARAVSNVVHAGSVLDLLFLQAVAGAKLGATVTVKVRVKGFAPTSIPVRVQRDPSGSPRLWVMAPESEVKAKQDADEARVTAAVDAALARQAAEFAREREREATSGMGARTLAYFEPNASVNVIDLLSRFDRVPLDDPDPGERGVIVRATAWILASPNEARILCYRIANRSDQVYRLSHVQLMNEAGTVDHAVGVTLEEPRGADGVWTIAPGEQVEGLLWVLEPQLLGEDAMLAINEPEGARPRVQRKIPVFDLRPPCGRPGFPKPCPLSPEEKERRREQAEQLRIAREAQRVSLHLVASYGAIWLPAGADGPEKLEPTSLKGLGVRVTKGFFTNLAMEAEIGGATSGVADYGTVTVDGTQGELTRSATLGRVAFGGVLRLGDKIVPTLRAGLSLQVVSQDASMVTAGGEMSGPEAGIEVAGGVYGGAGVDLKLGANLIAGAAVSYTAAQHNQQILDFGLNLAYRWDAAE